MRNLPKVAYAILMASILLVPAMAQNVRPPAIELSCDRPGALYEVGQEVAFKIALLNNGQPVADADLSYRIVANGETKEGVIKSAVDPQTVTCTAAAPGFISCQVTSTGEVKAEKFIYVGVEPDKIKAQTPCPPDFMEFWNKQKARLAEIPMNPVVTPVEITKEHLKKMVKAFDVKLDCVGGVPVTGYLTMPLNAGPEKRYPVRVSFQGHTYFPRAGSNLRDSEAAVQKMIFLDVNPHGLINGRPLDYYKAEIWPVLRGQLGPYPYRDWDDLEKVYFNGMFLRVVRSLEYAKTLPEWDGTNLIVEGSSMGGSQSLVAAALDPQVTTCVANVPAMGEHLGSVPGWPNLMANAKIADVARKNAPYYDMVNFALQIKTRTVVGVGFSDTICPPPSVWAIFNNIAATKKMVISPTGTHGWNQEMRDEIPVWVKQGLK